MADRLHQDEASLGNRKNDFTEWNPKPIIELDYSGDLVYLNLAARAQFPSLQELGHQHPILENLKKALLDLTRIKGEFSVFFREVNYLSNVYEQHIISFADKRSIFIYMDDITARMMAEKQLKEKNMELMEAMVLLSKDITEQKRLQEQLLLNRELEEQNRLAREANYLKNEFLENMSHELRTPLNGIIGFTQLVLDEKMGAITADQQDALNDVLGSAKLLQQSINDILDITKIEFEKIEFKPEKIDIKAVINEVLLGFHPLVQKKKTQVAIHIDDDLKTVFIDRTRFKQIIYNYLSNALKFTDEGAAVIIRCQPETAETFRFEVEDDGKTIEPDQTNKLFTAFQQLDSSTSKEYGGIGVGLFLTKQIVEAQDGKVGMTGLAKGKIFFAILPRIHSK